MRRALHAVPAGSGPEAARPLVAESWRRSAGVASDTDQPAPLRYAPDALHAYRAGHPLATVQPLIGDLLGAAPDDEHVYAVVDADGTLLWVDGARSTLHRAERMNFVAGAAWDERQMGTNAPGTALVLGQPVQIRAAEHFNTTVRRWSCAAAPLRDPDSGRLLGAVDVTGGRDVGRPQALALVRATARAVESELARRLQAADARARQEFARVVGPDDRHAMLVSPGGRILAGPPELLVAWAGVPGGRSASVEPIGIGGHLLVHVPDTTSAPSDALWLSALGRTSGELVIDGRTVRLRPRHSEILVALALAGDTGRSGGQLAVDLDEDELARVTLRAEISRLRSVLGAGVLAAEPYRLRRPLRSDFQSVRDLLSEGRVGAACAAYPGPLLPGSTAPAVVDARTALERHLRTQVLASTDVAVLRHWVGTAWGIDDALGWRRLADLLPGGSSPRAAAAVRARQLSADPMS